MDNIEKTIQTSCDRMKWKNIERTYSLESVQKNFKRGKKMKYMFFWGHQPSSTGKIIKSCFSQWWKSDFIIDGQKYSSMEKYMMAEKARLFGDEEILEEIMSTNDTKKIKALGRKVRNFDDALWDENKYSIVLKGNFAKFAQNEEMRDFLLETKERIIVEASPYDKVWGIGMSADDEKVENPLMWKGENLLGFALMEVRDEIRRLNV